MLPYASQLTSLLLTLPQNILTGAMDTIYCPRVNGTIEGYIKRYEIYIKTKTFSFLELLLY